MQQEHNRNNDDDEEDLIFDDPPRRVPSEVTLELPEPGVLEPRRSERARKPPVRLKDYVK